MSYISPAIQSKLDSLPQDLQQEILSRSGRLENMSDLIAILEQIVGEE